MTVSVLRSNAELNPADLLGYLEFHSIGELKIHKDQLGDIFDANGLDNKFLPREIKAHDAYRRATATATGSIDITTPNGAKKARLLVREVKADDNMVIRHLVREIVDSKNEILAYDTVGKFIFQRKSGTMNISWSPDYLDEYPYDILITDVQTLFVDWTQYHTRDTVNNIVRRIITDMNNVSILPNGKATFIPRHKWTTLEGLKGMIEDLKSFHTGNSESMVEIIPVIDTIDQRDMVQKRVEAQLSGEANTLLADFAELLTADKTSVKTVQRYAKRVIDLQDRLDEYENLIEKKMEVLSNQLGDALKRIQLTQSELDE
jgi:hypothetical protein